MRDKKAIRLCRVGHGKYSHVLGEANGNGFRMCKRCGGVVHGTG